jgi:hypothetical protein
VSSRGRFGGAVRWSVRGGEAVGTGGPAGDAEGTALGQSECGDGDPLRVRGGVPCAKRRGKLGTQRGAASSSRVRLGVPELRSEGVGSWKAENLESWEPEVAPVWVRSAAFQDFSSFTAHHRP